MLVLYYCMLQQLVEKLSKASICILDSLTVKHNAKYKEVEASYKEFWTRLSLKYSEKSLTIVCNAEEKVLYFFCYCKNCSILLIIEKLTFIYIHIHKS